MYGKLSEKIYQVRAKAVSTIIGYMMGNNLKTINCCEFTSNPPMVTPTQSLDRFYLEKGLLLYFDYSGEYDNDSCAVVEVSTDLLVEIVGFIEDYDKDIKEKYGQE